MKHYLHHQSYLKLTFFLKLCYIFTLNSQFILFQYWYVQQYLWHYQHSSAYRNINTRITCLLSWSIAFSRKVLSFEVMLGSWVCWGSRGSLRFVSRSSTTSSWLMVPSDSIALSVSSRSPDYKHSLFLNMQTAHFKSNQFWKQ